MTCAEGEAQECLAVHAAKMPCCEDGAAALSLDTDEGNKGEDREDGEQDEKAQYDVCQAFDCPVDDASQRKLGGRKHIDVASALASHRLGQRTEGKGQDVKHDTLFATKVCNLLKF